ncbi:MAG TPA: hypothetical protein VFP84_25455 [Kofleriaceae bacterium]|nr:hypothetical protein [Kofleriaceae bacterium]
MQRSASRRARRPVRSRAAGKRPARWRLRFAVLGSLVLALGIWTVHNAREPGPWQHVLATREGQIGDITSTRMIIKPDSMFVALPHPRALGRMVEVRYHDRALVVPVLDVGPWNIDDDYWAHDARPASERGHGYFRKPVNTAGIDLSDPVFAALGLPDNDDVEWRFVHRDYIVLPHL